MRNPLASHPPLQPNFASSFEDDTGEDAEINALHLVIGLEKISVSDALFLALLPPPQPLSALSKFLPNGGALSPSGR